MLAYLVFFSHSYTAHDISLGTPFRNNQTYIASRIISFLK